MPTEEFTLNSYIHFSTIPETNLFRPLKMKILFYSLILIYALNAHADDFNDLFRAATDGNTERLQSLLAAGLNVNAKSATGRTALMGACYNGNLRNVKVLLNYGADVNATDSMGNTALMDAIRFADKALIQTLIAAGADVNAVDNKGLTILARAKKIAPASIIKLLENAGAKETSKTETETADGTTEEKKDDNAKDKPQKEADNAQ